MKRTLEEKEEAGQEYLRGLQASHPHRVMSLPTGRLALRPHPKLKVGRSVVALHAKAARPKPAQCEECQSERPDLAAHHVVSYNTLKRQGRQHDLAAHILIWLCPICHLAKHEHEPVGNLMRSKVAT